MWQHPSYTCGALLPELKSWAPYKEESCLNNNIPHWLILGHRWIGTNWMKFLPLWLGYPDILWHKWNLIYFFVKYFYKDGYQDHRIITNSENLWQTWPHCSDKADQVILWPFELVCGKMQRYLQLWVSKATTCKQSIIVQISLDKMLRKMEFQRGAMNFFLNWAKGNNCMMCS